MSSSDVAIRVHNLSKCFEIYSAPHDRLKQFVIPRLQRLARREIGQYFREFWALKDISFEIKKGETVGIIGRNGSGKSTLLQIICGTLTPTSGSVETHGRVAALLELGSGFNPEFTGRENVYMYAAVLGLSAHEIDKRYHEIVDFADIGEFINQPVKTYSSGMIVRLAFAVIAHVDADILVIDEALAVGDAYFTQKCMRFLREFADQGTLIFVSHDSNAVVGLCNKAILLREGIIERIGNPKDVTEYYLLLIHEQQVVSLPKEEAKVTTVQNPPRSNNDFGTGAAVVLSATLMHEDGSQLLVAKGGEIVSLSILIRANESFFNPLVGFVVKDRIGQIVFGDNTAQSCALPNLLSMNVSYLVNFVFEMPMLQNGEYAISAAIGCGSQDNHTHFHWVNDVLVYNCLHTRPCFGVVGIQTKQISAIEMKSESS